MLYIPDYNLKHLVPTNLMIEDGVSPKLLKMSWNPIPKTSHR